MSLLCVSLKAAAAKIRGNQLLARRCLIDCCMLCSLISFYRRGVVSFLTFLSFIMSASYCFSAAAATAARSSSSSRPREGSDQPTKPVRSFVPLPTSFFSSSSFSSSFYLSSSYSSCVEDSDNLSWLWPLLACLGRYLILQQRRRLQRRRWRRR
jgi:hypothetical protein